MKKFLIALLPIVLLVAACSKEKSLEDGGTATNGGAGYYLRMKIDGVDKTFNNSLFAIKQDTLGVTQYAVFGAATTDPTSTPSFVITVTSNAAITNGSTFTVEDTTLNYILVAVYSLNASQPMNIFESGTGDQSNSPLKMTITSVNATEISGTFSGTIFEADTTGTPNPNPPTKLLTAGEFKAKFL